jgi:RimJ/RimL family protein N-acetyltransferase
MATNLAATALVWRALQSNSLSEGGSSMKIMGSSLYLRAIERTDLPTLMSWANDPVTQDGIGEIHFPSSLAFHESWFEAQLSDPSNQRFVVQIPDGDIIGLSSLINIDWRNRHAWHGLIIGDSSHRGKGYGVDAIMATMKYAFDELNLVRLDGSMIEYNEPSIAAYCGPKLGWREEGRKRNYFYRKGRFWDQVIVGVTREDYEIVCETTGYWNE